MEDYASVARVRTTKYDNVDEVRIRIEHEWMMIVDDEIVLHKRSAGIRHRNRSALSA